jgi:hypothetical protein
LKWKSKELFPDTFEKSNPVKSQFNASMNAAKQLNLENILHDLNKSSELSGYLNNTTNSARQRVNNEHNSSMAPYIKKGQLKKIASHNKSSNLAFSILGKSELLEDRQTQVSQSRKYDRVSSVQNQRRLGLWSLATF